MIKWQTVVFILRHLWITERTSLRFSLAVLLLEPLLLFWGFGYGMGNMIGSIDNHTYPEFLFPGILCFSSMAFAFSEASWGLLRRWKSTPLLKQIKYTPISHEQLVWAELAWSTFHGLLATLPLMIVGVFFDYVSFGHLPLLFVYTAITSFIGALSGMALLALISGHLSMIFLSNIFVFPLAFFSGTFFPIAKSTFFFEWLGFLFPLIHTTEILKAFLWSQWGWMQLVHLVYLIALPIVLVKKVLPLTVIRAREQSLNLIG